MFNCELWTNPQWSFDWPPSLSVWMGRWCAGIDCFCEFLEDSLKLPRLLLFQSLVCRIWLWRLYVWSLMTICYFYDSVVEMRIYIGDVLWFEIWLLRDVLLNTVVMLFLFRCGVLRKLLFMHAWWFIEDVTSKFLICRIISVIYRF
jgi:hypothetical protein